MSKQEIKIDIVSPVSFFNEFVFIIDRDDDPFWVAMARDFFCSCIAETHIDKPIAQIFKTFAVAEDRNNMSSYKKFDKYKKSENPKIQKIFEFNEKQKLSIYKIIQQKFDTYLKSRNVDTEKAYDFFATDGIYQITLDCWFKELYRLQNSHAGEVMVCGDIVKPITYGDLVNEIKGLPDGLNNHDKNYTIQQKIREKTKYIISETDVTVYNNQNFKNIKASFNLVYGSTTDGTLKKFKISPTKFAMLTKNAKIFCVIDNKEKTKRLYKQFKEFAKKAAKWNKPKHIEYVSVISDAWYTGKFGMFKKLPEISATCEFLTGIFKSNGFDIDGSFAETNEVIKILNQNSKLDHPIGADYDTTISENLIANGYELTRNYMSHDYTLKTKTNTTFVSFAGYPNDETAFKLTQYKFNKKSNNLYGIKVGTKIEVAEKVLEHFGYEKFSGNYVNKKVIIKLKTENGAVARVDIRLQSEYLGNRIY